CEPVSIRILLPVHEVLRRRHPERVTFDPRAAMGGWAQPDDLRREADRPVVAVARDVVETGEDRHTLLCCAKAITLLRYFRCNFWAGRRLWRGCGTRGGGNENGRARVEAGRQRRNIPCEAARRTRAAKAEPASIEPTRTERAGIAPAQDARMKEWRTRNAHPPYRRTRLYPV